MSDAPRQGSQCHSCLEPLPEGQTHGLCPSCVTHKKANDARHALVFLACKWADWEQAGNVEAAALYEAKMKQAAREYREASLAVVE